MCHLYGDRKMKSRCPSRDKCPDYDRCKSQSETEKAGRMGKEPPLVPACFPDTARRLRARSRWPRWRQHVAKCALNCEKWNFGKSKAYYNPLSLQNKRDEVGGIESRANLSSSPKMARKQINVNGLTSGRARPSLRIRWNSIRVLSPRD